MNEQQAIQPLLDALANARLTKYEREKCERALQELVTFYQTVAKQLQDKLSEKEDGPPPTEAFK